MRQICKELVSALASLDGSILCSSLVNRSHTTVNSFTENRQPRRPDGRNRYLYVMGRYVLVSSSRDGVETLGSEDWPT